MMDRNPLPIVIALANLPNEHLWSLGDSISGIPASLVMAWLADLVLWERKRRFGEEPGDLPEPSIQLDQLPVTMLLLHVFAGSFRADTGMQEVEPVIRLFEAATAHQYTNPSAGAWLTSTPSRGDASSACRQEARWPLMRIVATPCGRQFVSSNNRAS